MSRITVAIIVLFSLGIHHSSAQTKVTFKGTIKYHFDMSNTNAMDSLERVTLEKELDSFETKMPLLKKYYYFLNNYNEDSAEYYLNQDSSLLAENSLTLVYTFWLARMREIGILYHPCIQAKDTFEGKQLISCSPAQREALMKNRSREYILECEYLDDMVVDNVKVYKLISYR